MQSALVRKDAVMLHDPMRTHSRATAVGVIVAAIGLLGFLLFGILKAAPQVPGAGIVIGKESGQIYVKTEATATRPAMLIPTFNLASARLILMGQTAPGGAGGPQPAVNQIQAVEPTVVPDDRLKDIPRGRLQGIPTGPPLLPDEGQRISDNWSVCDNLAFDPSLTAEENLRQTNVETAVLAGVSELGTPLGENQAIYAQNERGTYLIYRPAENANVSSDMVVAEINPGDKELAAALKLESHTPRKISSAVLDAIQPVDPVKALDVPGKTTPSPFDLGGAPVTVGGVFKTIAPAGDEYEFYLLTRDGRQRVTEAVAQIVAYTHKDAGLEIPAVSPGLLAGIPPVEVLPLDTYPNKVPEVLDPLSGYSATCLGWTTVGEDDNVDSRTTLYVGPDMPLPKGADGNEVKPYKIGQANAKGSRIDAFYMPPGRAAVVHAATGKESFKSGPISLISDTGMRFDIPDLLTAAHLGVKDPRPAPEAIIGLLPGAADALSAQAAQQTFDSVVVDRDAVSYGANNAGG